MTDAAPSASAPAARRPRQARSRDTEERILRALGELLAKKPFDRLSVTEIAAHAGVSVGGFYARFASKHDALLHLSYESYVAEAERLAGRVLAPERWRGKGIAPLAEAYFHLLLEAGRPHLPVLRELVQRNRARADEALAADSYDRFREAVHEPFRRLLYERIGEVTHPDPELALRVGYSATSAALREAALFPHMRPSTGPIGERALAREIARMLCGYLGAPFPEDAAPEEGSS